MEYGNGVTKNFLAILESERDRSARRVSLLVVVAALVVLAAWPLMQNQASWALGSLGGIVVVAATLGALWANYVVIPRYNVSLRGNWNRWMRLSMSCASVRECYRTVHSVRRRGRVVLAVLVITFVLAAHLALGVALLNQSAAWSQALPVFALDGALAGFFLGKRFLERRYYKRFIQSVHELLREGSIGVWGVY